jgi:hypothetical protein
MESECECECVVLATKCACACVEKSEILVIPLTYSVLFQTNVSAQNYQNKIQQLVRFGGA